MPFLSLMSQQQGHARPVNFCVRKPSVSLLLGILLVSPWLTGCHQEIEGENIDIPPERPGRFLPEASEAEARRAREDVARQEQAEALHPEKYKTSSSQPYEAIAPGNASSGPLTTGDGHMVIPQEEPVYGNAPKQKASATPSAPQAQ
ncbi:hypothetical protein [Acetobacter thailandicus]|uniref:hypothetical protein n=1 Tax=Acetobacter thailandicus TaxID=1502842 RepID=UPI001BAA2B95|nr:hypothetical protein [Acetobacter thailandicus]